MSKVLSLPAHLLNFIEERRVIPIIGPELGRARVDAALKEPRT